MSNVVHQRLERLACGFDLSDNYFAWQAFGRRYATDEAGPLPPYLRRENFDNLRARVGDVEVQHRSLTERLASKEAASLDAYVLLDAQDWMTDEILNDLWGEIERTARPGARVIFRTAGEESILPGRVPDSIMSKFTYDAGALSCAGGEGPVVHLRRLPPLCIPVGRGGSVSSATRDAARHMDGIYKYQRHIYNATRKYYLLGRDLLLDELRAGGRVNGSRNWLRHRPKPHPCGETLSERRVRWFRHFARNARDGAHVDRASGLSDRIDVYQADATAFDLSDLCGERHVRRVLVYLHPLDGPWMAAGAGAGVRSCRSRRPAAHFGLRPTRGLAPVVRGMFCSLALRQFSVYPRAELESELTKLANDTGAALEFRRLYRGYVDYAVITKPATQIQS